MAVRTTKPASRNTTWRRAISAAATSGLLAAGLLTGAGTAHADVLDDISAAYDTGAGGGEVSVLIHSVMKLRSLGFVPSKGNMADLQDAMTKRPNEMPLIAALSGTVAYMKRSQMRAQQSGPSLNPPTIGIGGAGSGPPNPNGGGGGINIPLG